MARGEQQRGGGGDRRDRRDRNQEERADSDIVEKLVHITASRRPLRAAGASRSPP